MRLNLLFLCTGNSARSLIAEGVLRQLGGNAFNAFSAGSRPTGKPNPHAIAVLRQHDIDTGFARSKSWDEFAGPDADTMDIVITVCANAAGETCPVWPGHPHTAHWGVEDPAAVTGSCDDIMAAFAVTFEVPHASTRREAMRLAHRHCAAFQNQMLLEAQIEHVAMCEPLADSQVLEGVVRHVLEEASKPSHAESLGLPRPLSATLDKSVVDSRVQALYTKIYAAVNTGLALT